jgi:hypothetical protein
MRSDNSTDLESVERQVLAGQNFSLETLKPLSFHETRHRLVISIRTGTYRHLRTSRTVK